MGDLRAHRSGRFGLDFRGSHESPVHIFAFCSSILYLCFQHPQAAKPSSSPVSDAATTFHPASGSFRSNPSTLSVPSVANSAGTCRLRSSSVGLTNSWFTSSVPEAGDVRPGRSDAENQPWHGLPRRVPDCRYPTGTGAARRLMIN